MRSKAITGVILAVILCLLVVQGVVRATTWKTVFADVDWDNSVERIRYKTDEPSPYYPWKVPFLEAYPTLRGSMEVQNLREKVYFQSEIILDEGYWDKPDSGPPQHYAWLYNSKDTFVDDQGYIVTRWESDYAILNRTADLTDDGCTLKYEIWLKAFGYEPGPEPLAEFGVGILWNAEPRGGTPEESFSYILGRMESYYSEYADSYKGITVPGLSFMTCYTFDDTMKHVSDHSLIAWDGATPREYIAAGIRYEDPDFSPVGHAPVYLGRSKAIWGIVHLPTPAELSVTTGQFVDGIWQGVGATGKDSQETCARYGTRIYVDPYFNGVEVNGTFSVNITVENVADLYAYSFKLEYPPYVSKLVSIGCASEGPFLMQGGETLFVCKIDTFKGQIRVGCMLLGTVPGVSGNGTLATITFQCVAPGECILDLQDTVLLDSGLVEIPHTTHDGYSYNGFPVVPDAFAPPQWNINTAPPITVRIDQSQITGTIDDATIRLWHTGPDSVWVWDGSGSWNAASGRAQFDGSEVNQTLIDGTGLYTLTVTFKADETPYLAKGTIEVFKP